MICEHISLNLNNNYDGSHSINSLILNLRYFIFSILGASGVSMAEDFFQIPSTSAARTRMLEFNIQFNDRMIQLKVFND